MAATALISTKRRFSSLNHQNIEFFGLVPRSPTHTGLICVKTLEPNISSLGPFNGQWQKSRIWIRKSEVQILGSEPKCHGSGTSKIHVNNVWFGPPTWQRLDRLQWQRPWQLRPTEYRVQVEVENRHGVLQPQTELRKLRVRKIGTRYQGRT